MFKFREFILIRDTLFTLPKPLDHLFYHLINIVLEGSVRRGRACLH